MQVIIMGCGRLGEAVARLLHSEGHAVTIVDRDAEALARLGPAFAQRTVCGYGYDHATLLQAGIETAEAFIATSSSDNANVLTARIARNIFRVPRVLARVYDSRNADIYNRLGLQTICPTTWGAARALQLLAHAAVDSQQSFGQGEVELVRAEVPRALDGQSVSQLQVAGEITVASITRDNQAFVPVSGTLLRAGDIVHVSVLAAALDRLVALLALKE